jgi:hypothetical protein
MSLEQHGTTIEYTNTLADVVAFARHHYDRSEGIQRSIRLQRYGGVTALAGYFIGLCFLSGSSFYLLVAAVTSTAWWIWIPNVLSSTYEKQVLRTYESGRNRTTFGKHRLALTPHHIEEKNEFGESRVLWPAIERVDSDAQHTFIYLGSSHAYIVPRNQVLSGDYDSFVHALREAHLAVG